MENNELDNVIDNADDFEPELFTLVDEDGKEATFELLDEMELDGNRYFAFAPYYADMEEETARQAIEDDGDLVILKEQVVDGEELMVTIDDDNEYDKVGDIFLDRLEKAFAELFGDEEPAEDD